MSHLTDAEISLFFACRLTPEDSKRVIRHLATCCPDCLTKAAPYGDLVDGKEREPGLPGLAEAIYDPLLDRVFAAVLRQVENQATAKLWRDWFVADVRGRGLQGYFAVSDAMDGDAPGLALIETDLALSFEARYRDPEQMVHFAQSALVTALNLGKHRDLGRYTPQEVADLQARTWGEYANAFRVCEDTGMAEHGLRESENCRLQGSGSRLLQARLLDIKASLRTDLRNLEEACALLDEVHDLYLEAGEPHLAGRALIKKGMSLYYDDRLQGAVESLLRGLSMLNQEQDPKLLAAGRQFLLFAMTDEGEFSKAGQLLRDSRLRESFANEPLALLKIDWLEGRVLSGLGEPERAEQVLVHVEDGFLQVGLEYEAALASLERAGALLQLGRLAEVEALAEEALETFRLLEVGREALRAVEYLREACLQRTATMEVVRQVVRFLERLQRKPYLRFAAPA